MFLKDRRLALIICTAVCNLSTIVKCSLSYAIPASIMYWKCVREQGALNWTENWKWRFQSCGKSKHFMTRVGRKCGAWTLARFWHARTQSVAHVWSFIFADVKSEGAFFFRLKKLRTTLFCIEIIILNESWIFFSSTGIVHSILFSIQIVLKTDPRNTNIMVLTHPS